MQVCRRYFITSTIHHRCFLPYADSYKRRRGVGNQSLGIIQTLRNAWGWREGNKFCYEPLRKLGGGEGGSGIPELKNRFTDYDVIKSS